MIKRYFFFFLFLLNFSAFAQNFAISEAAKISILTIGPGDNLYDKFGHSAYRIKDETRDIDIVYNYGVYDFDTPNFYTKFARGKLLYKLQVSPFQPFIDMYIAQNRWVEEQILDVTYAQKQGLFKFLQNNALPENKYYKYDFFYDNCATRIRDVLVKVLGDSLEYRADLAAEGYTFRELIQKNVYWNSWGSMGMDVAIGAVVDQKATSWEYQFLPEYVSKAAAGAVVSRNGDTVSLVSHTNTIYTAFERENQGDFLTSPLLFFGLLGLLIVFFTWKDFKRERRNSVLDVIIFSISGLIGFILLFLWIGTDHSTTANNYNLLWAFPLSLFLVTLICKRPPKRWIQRYIIFLMLMLILLFFHWITGVQVFALAMLPLFIGLCIRYFFLAGFLRKQNN